MKIAIIGPIAVGKSTVSQITAKQLDIEYIDYDTYKSASPRILKFRTDIIRMINIDKKINFLMDIGGNCVFRANVNNNKRIDQVHSVVNDYGIIFCMLFANKEILTERWVKTGEPADTYESIYNEWRAIEEPNWRKIVVPNLTIDTSHLNPTKTAEILLSKLVKTIK